MLSVNALDITPIHVIHVTCIHVILKTLCFKAEHTVCVCTCTSIAYMRDMIKFKGFIITKTLGYCTGVCTRS